MKASETQLVILLLLAAANNETLARRATSFTPVAKDFLNEKQRADVEHYA